MSDQYIGVNRKCRSAKALALSVTLVLVSGCLVVGPDYQPPQTEAIEQFEHATADAFTSKAPSAEFWQVFDDHQLTSLVELGLTQNNDIAVAVARLDESRAVLGLSPYSNFPTVTALASSDRSSQSGRDPFTFEGLGISEVHQLQFDSSWEIDLFGSLHRQNQQIKTLTESYQATLHDVQRIVVGDIVQNYFSLRGLQAQLAVQSKNLANQKRTVEILSGSLKAGRGTALDVARAQSLERTVAASIPTIESTISRTLQRLAVLTAQSSIELSKQLATDQLPAMPDQIDLGTPDEWLRRRPDVRAAERQLASATAGIGVETAEFYPKLTLLGSFGYTGKSLGDIGDSDAQRWNFGPSLQWRFLDYGRVRQDVRAAQARQRQAVAQFQNVVLGALEDMENALATYRATSQTMQAIQEALAFSAKASSLAKLRYDNGASNYLELLDVERTKLELANQHAQAVTAQATAVAAVYKALAAN